MSVLDPNNATSPSHSAINQLSLLLKAQGHSACAVIDQHLFFHVVSHSPAMQCAILAADDCVPVAVRPISGSGDLERMNLQESVQRFLDQPKRFTKAAGDLVCIFLSGWIKQVAAQSAHPNLVVAIAEQLVEVEHWLSNDGPGSCVIAGQWLIWATGRYGMSDILIARNAGDLPSPDLTTASRWDGIGQFNESDLVSLEDGLDEWKACPSVWSFRERAVPYVGALS
ncbi:hypothetical protein [Pseudomonas baetica]|uniref:hypothetical protein n=1 Tax=Pseudomonas baetica TaxID=674054 RepID=UPI0024053F70|nr:hypothetical protein [Pseudomonas baetica]MDF9779125.1 hypothetical protein [Pseudomonas baetica]